MSTFRLVSEGAHPDSEWLSPYDPPFAAGGIGIKNVHLGNSPAPGLAPHESSSFWVASRERTLIGAYDSKVVGVSGLSRRRTPRSAPRNPANLSMSSSCLRESCRRLECFPPKIVGPLFS